MGWHCASRSARRTAAAEAIASDTDLQAWRDAGRYDTSRGRVANWLLIICRSRAFDHLRRRDKAESYPEPEIHEDAVPSLDADVQDLPAASQSHGARMPR